jgi:hypothetical protein
MAVLAVVVVEVMALTFLLVGKELQDKVIQAHED